MKAPIRIPVAVSDHALLRYMERVYGVDIESVRAEVAAIVAGAAALGACAVRRDGHYYVIANNVVTTVLPPENHVAARATHTYRLQADR